MLSSSSSFTLILINIQTKLYSFASLFIVMLFITIQAARHKSKGFL